MTQKQFLRLLHSEIGKFPTRWKAAELLGISESALSRVLRGKQEPNESLLGRFGLSRQIVYIGKHKNPFDVNSLTVDTKINPDENCVEVEG